MAEEGSDLTAGSEYGWRRRPVAGVLRLRPAIAEHSEEEARLLQRYARGARCAVEIGVAEGASARRIREVIAPEGTLYLIDPYPPGRLWVNMQSVIARRRLRGVRRGRVEWLRALSTDAARSWTRTIDFLHLDGDVSPEGVRRDWRDWSRHVRAGGAVALKGRAAPDTWVTPDWGPAQLVQALGEDPDWEVVDGTGAVAVLRRAA